MSIEWPVGRVMTTEQYVKETGEAPPKPVRSFEDTFSAETVIMEHFFPEKANPMDGVDQPAHYARRKMQAIEYIAINKLEWWEANVVKYCARWDAKDGLKDLYKARSYLDMKIREIEGHERFWEKPVGVERKLNGSR